MAKSGHTQVLKQLVNAKADIDVQDSRSGKTALHHAVENGDLPMTGYLVTEVRSTVCVCVCTWTFVRYMHVSSNWFEMELTFGWSVASFEVIVDDIDGHVIAKKIGFSSNQFDLRE